MNNLRCKRCNYELQEDDLWKQPHFLCKKHNILNSCDIKYTCPNLLL